MEIYWKVLGGLLIAVVFGMVLGKDMSALLSIAVCAMGAVVALRYLQPVLSAIQQMAQATNLQSDMLQILIKILGISLISEIAAVVCNAAGATGICKLLKVITCTVILWIAIPVFETVLSLLQQILGEL